jgi:hypothetical protein
MAAKELLVPRNAPGRFHFGLCPSITGAGCEFTLIRGSLVELDFEDLGGLGNATISCNITISGHMVPQ